MADKPYVTVSDAAGYVDPITGMWVPTSFGSLAPQQARGPKTAYDPPTPPVNVDYQPAFGLGMTQDTTGNSPLWGGQNSAAAAKGAYDAPPYPTSNIPLPPQRPAASALQRYQTASQPSTFGSNVPLPPPRPEEDGPPMPTQAQMASAAPPAPYQQQPLGIAGNSPLSDPSSAQNFWRQPTQGTLDNNSGSGLMSLFHNVSGNNPQSGNGAGSNFKWVRPDSIVGKLMSLYNNAGQGKPMDYSDGPLGRIMQQFTS